jgi:hypothetical protein
VGILRLALPAALALWFIWKARSNALFLLGIPVLMVMRGAVFFQNMKPFWMPGRLASVTLLMGWLVLVWAVTVMRRTKQGDDASIGPFGAARLLPEELPLLGIAVLIGLHTLTAFASRGDLVDSVNLASVTFYFALGYLLVRGIASQATRAETQEFLAAVVIVNTLACGLYFLHQGLHLPIYLGEANITYTYAGQDVARATTFAPAFNLLALGFVLAKRRWSAGWMAVLVITLLAILVSLTRTMLVAAAVGLILALVARELSRPDFGRAARRAGAIVLAGVLIVVAFSRVAPAYWAVLLKRLGELTSTGTGQVQNWHVRTVHWEAVARVVNKSDSLLGLGFPLPASNPVDSHIVLWSSDMAWLPIMYRFGFLGLVLFGLLLAGFLVRALSLSLRPPELRRELALAYFIALALTTIMAFENWVFMNPLVSPMGLWLFAFIAAETLRPSEQPEDLVAAAHPLTAPGISRRLHLDSS